MTTAYTDTTSAKTTLALLRDLQAVALLHYPGHLPDRSTITVARLVEDLAATLPAGITRDERREADDAVYVWAKKEPTTYYD